MVRSLIIHEIRWHTGNRHISGTTGTLRMVYPSFCVESPSFIQLFKEKGIWAILSVRNGCFWIISYKKMADKAREINLTWTYRIEFSDWIFHTEIITERYIQWRRQGSHASHIWNSLLFYQPYVWIIITYFFSMLSVCINRKRFTKGSLMHLSNDYKWRVE